MVKTLLTALLERAIKRYLQLDPETLTELGKLSGKVVKLEPKGWDATFYLFPSDSGIRWQNVYEGEVDATIKGSPISLLRLSLGSSEKTVEMANEVEMSGDMEIAHTMNRLLKNIQIDWEEHLSRVVGDTLGRKIGHALERTKRWGASTFANMRQNMTDYLQEEARYLPTRREVEDFCLDVTTLRNDVDRLDAALKRKTTA